MAAGSTISKTRAQATRLTLLASAAQTSSGNGSAISVGPFREAMLTLNCTAASGTTPTLSVSIQVSDDGGTTWYTLPGTTFTQLATTGSQVGWMQGFGDTIRVSYTIGGTSPSFTFAVKAVLK